MSEIKDISQEQFDAVLKDYKHILWLRAQIKQLNVATGNLFESGFQVHAAYEQAKKTMNAELETSNEVFINKYGSHVFIMMNSMVSYAVRVLD